MYVTIFLDDDLQLAMYFQFRLEESIPLLQCLGNQDMKSEDERYQESTKPQRATRSFLR